MLMQFFILLFLLNIYCITIKYYYILNIINIILIKEKFYLKIMIKLT